jgi:protein-L-isoaspartate(D-aspartate) O-methyltransferase
MDFTMKRQQLPGKLRLAGIIDERVLSAVHQVPRERFVPTGMRHLTYAPLPITLGFGQAMLPLPLSAIMLQALHLTGAETVLEIGTGSGYDAVLLSHLAKQVHTIERLEPLRQMAQTRFEEMERPNIRLHTPAGPLGHPADGPYDAIVVTAAAPCLPIALLEQLRPQGRLVVPIGGRSQQQLLAVRRTDDGLQEERLGGCAVGPLIGDGGWPDAPMQEAPRPWF